MKSSFLTSLGLVGISSYPFGAEPKDLKDGEKTRLGTEWKDQTTGEKVVTAITLPFRAVKRVVVAQPAISVGVVAGGIAGGLVGSYMGYMGWLFAGSIAGGLVIGGLIGWGVSAFFGADHRTGKSYATAAKAPVSTENKALFNAEHTPVSAAVTEAKIAETVAPAQQAAA